MKQKFSEDTYLFASNAVFIEEMYQKYAQDPNSVSAEWRSFFSEVSSDSKHPSWEKVSSKIITESNEPANPVAVAATEVKEETLHIDNLRTLGHLAAKLDPLGLDLPKSILELGIDPSHPKLCLYTSTTGVEFAHVYSESEKEWLYNRYEELCVSSFSKEQKIEMLTELVKIDSFEQFIHKKFPGAKRFSVEGGDASVVSTKNAIEISGSFGIENVVIGMAHRGRLNTLARVLAKPYEALFGEFMGVYSIPSSLGLSGDVKYHMGYSHDVTTKYGQKMHLSLACNPSHLEAVNPVAAGNTRARQDLSQDPSRQKSMTILVHGDAAFCGQGVVTESLSMSVLDAFDVGGIFHIIVNNQVGFTANPKDGHKASRYSSEVAKIIGAPIIHVNGDDIEAVQKATRLLMEYRARYKKDAVLEIICYRKYGHNEGDEPMYTQPVMYSIIKNKTNPARIYLEKLEKEGVLGKAEFEKIESEFWASLEDAYNKAKDYTVPSLDFSGIWASYSRSETESDKTLATGVARPIISDLLTALSTFPKNFAINPKLQKLFDKRLKDFNNESIIDWATAEQLAFGTLLKEGFPIRLIGQDAGRGTFSHRHSVLHDQNSGARFIPLSQINQSAKYEVHDSNLSEYAVLGFELGYSMANPKSLVIWEAQFGDFSNGAQIIIDQFISSMETKWLKLSGLVMLLPHSYEGQGPEHSSARLERYLQLCAEDNIQVAYPTTPANIFHLLRRQQLRAVRKPLIIMSPKSIFRHSLAISKISEIEVGTGFKAIYGDDISSYDQIRKVILCSGKIYYDLFEARQKNNQKDLAIIRIEQLYPFPQEALNKELAKYASAKELVWCQEEPENMGVWQFLKTRYANSGPLEKIQCVSRKESASPATGYASVHAKEQQDLINKALK
ncbi:MAG: 2-oxoglutarate dehydrogenase E1 component [Rickettsiaceae bacterium]|nr:2-oxoglutarate dehydrogenase E1 component [Rickettsiaceae bacterium]